MACAGPGRGHGRWQFRQLPPNPKLARLIDCRQLHPLPPPRPVPDVRGQERTSHGDGFHPHPRRADAQPQEHRPRPAPRQADRDHRPVRLGQVLAGVRHHLRRGPAPLRRVAVGLRAAVPERDGEAGPGPHRGPVAGDLDRAEVHQPQPALDRGHHHRDLRLPAPALRPRRQPALPRPRLPAGSADRQPDGRPGAGAGPGTALHAAGAGDPRAQGRARAGVRPAARAGLRARARGRRTARNRRGTAAGAAPEAHHRGGDRPLPPARGPQAAPGRELRDRAQAGRRHGHRAVAGRRAGGAAAVLVQVLLPGLRLRAAGAGAAPVLVQLAGRRLPGLRRPGHGRVLRPRAAGTAATPTISS